jgi:hypothetical protein
MAKKQVKQDIDSFLKGQNTKKETTSKSKVPLNNDFGTFADEVYTAVQEAHDAQTIADAKKKEAIEKARTLYESRALAGEFSKSINFEGVETNGIQVTFKDEFRIEKEGVAVDEDEVVGLIGQELFNKYFEQRRKIVVKATDNASIVIFREKLGDALFNQLFEVSLSIGCKSDMDRKQFEAPQEVKGLLKQVGSTVKTR